ncbi:hypothetical protein K438DRAFT_970587 [Mycena galopus ATCC 62051]|nr:hypothetical protein K438DRAFT_970587 [Mycena galopus ATCC 62051]
MFAQASEFQAIHVSGGTGGNGGAGSGQGGGGGAGNGPTMNYRINTDSMAMNLYVGLDLSENASLLGNFLESYFGGNNGRGDNRDFGEVPLLERFVEHRAQRIRRERLQARKKKNIAFQNRLGRQTWSDEVPKKRKPICGPRTGSFDGSSAHRMEEVEADRKSASQSQHQGAQRNPKIPGTVAKSRNEDVLSHKTILVTLCVLTAGVFVVQLTVLTVAVTLRWPLRQHR